MNWYRIAAITITIAVPVVTTAASRPDILPLPAFGKSCIGHCEVCSLTDYMQFTPAATVFNSLLDGYATCDDRVLGPCDTFGNCDVVIGGSANSAEREFETTEVLRREVWASARGGAVQRLRELMQEYPEYISFNETRGAIQVINCDGNGIMMSVPIPAGTINAMTTVVVAD